MPDEPMANAPTKPQSDRRHVRVALLLILLAAAADLAYLQHRRAASQAAYQPKSPERRETIVHGVPLTILSHLPYAQAPGVRPDQLLLDLYIPRAVSKAPLLIYLHGGGWLAGDKSGIGPKGEVFAAQGIVVASVNYRLAPVTPSPNACDDIAAAIAMLRRIAPSIGADPDRFVIMGHSAGAHLAALTVADERYLSPHAGPASAIRGLILLDGSAYDVPRMMQSERGRLFDSNFGDNPAIWTQVSPLHFARNGNALPSTLLAYAGDDVLRAQAAHELADAIQRNGGSAVVISLPGKTHESIDSDLCEPGDPFMERILEFINQTNSDSRTR